MPTIGNNAHTFLQGLSDFWIRFFADYDELSAFYQGTEISIAQVYLDLLSTFLNVSLLEAPIFNTEYFKLVAIREDQVALVEGANPDQNRYVVSMPDNVAVADILQNKVLDPTAILETALDYDQDNTDYLFKFRNDPSGRSGNIVSETTTGSLLTYGTGLFVRLYTVNADEYPFASARVGQWVQIAESGSGNNGVFPVKEVIDGQAVLIDGTFTLPEGNNGRLSVKLFEIEFISEPGFANRTVNIDIGGSFDDPAYRSGTTMSSWYFTEPRGRAICKGDIIRILGSNDPLVKDALPELPADFPITVVRHDALYFAPTELLLKSLTDATYVILRRPADYQVLEDFITFTRTGTLKPAIPLFNANLLRLGDETILQLPIGSPETFAITDQGRYIDLDGCGDILWFAQLDSDGTLTWTGGFVTTPLAIASVSGIIEITGSSFDQSGQYTITAIDSETVCSLSGGPFIPETITARLINVTNSGIYRIKRWIDARNVVVDRAASCPDPANGAIGWQIYDGYQASLDHTRIVRGSLVVHGVTGTPYEGGYRQVQENTDYTVDYETGLITQIGRFTGRWGLGSPEMTNATYEWLREVVTQQPYAGSLSVALTTLAVREVALWAPDAKVDKYHLYNNYGQYINRFQPSSETYRAFIRGIFQLYILGPALRHIESALNVIAGFEVARDDGEYLTAYSADADHKYVTTQRIDGTVYTYVFDVKVAVRTDIEAWVTGQPTIVFEAFEPLTEMFVVTDYVQDPVWWENIVIPHQLLPEEDSERRTTVPMLFDNVIGAIDGPRIGDPGLFIGADDEGLIPAWAMDLQPSRTILGDTTDQIIAATRTIRLTNGALTLADVGRYIRISNSSVGNNGDYLIIGVLSPIDAVVADVIHAMTPLIDEGAGFLSSTDGIYYRDFTAAKRRKMANVVMNTFLKYHMFYVSFDANLADLVALDFIQDLRELVLVGKPGYCLAYIEPASNFRDTLWMVDPSVKINVTWDETDGVIVGNSLYIESGTWLIGRVFRPGAVVTGAPLLTADGLAIPAPVTIAPYLAGVHVNRPVGATGFYGEPRDYSLDRFTGLLTPRTVWPAGVYTVDYRPLTVNPSSAKDPSLGDTDFLIGGLNPIVGDCQVEYYRGGILEDEGDYVTFTALDPVFDRLHEGARISIRYPYGFPVFTIVAVLSSTKVIIDNAVIPTGTDLLWSFFSREPYDGQLVSQADGWHLRTQSGMFRHIHKQQHIRIKDATVSGGANNGYWPILDVFSAFDILVGGTHVAETGLHWQLIGGSNLSIVEQPLQIRVY